MPRLSSDEYLNGFFVADADKVDTTVGKVESSVVGMCGWGTGDVSSHEVEDVDRLLCCTLYGELQLVRSHNIAARVVGVVNTEG